MSENRLALWLLLGVLSGGVLWLFNPFLQYIIVALLLSVASVHLHQPLERLPLPRWLNGYRDGISALMLTSGFLLFIFGPLAYFLATTYRQLATVDYGRLPELFRQVIAFLKALPDTLAFVQPIVDTLLEKAGAYSVQNLQPFLQKGVALLGNAGGVVAEIGWILVFYFLFNLYGRKIYTFLDALIPLSRDQKQYLSGEFSGTLAVVFYGALVTMAFQGIAFGALMLFFPGYNALYLGVLAGFFSVIPVVGAALVWVPVVLMEVVAGHWLSAVVVALYSVVVMGFLIDNILRIVVIGVMKKRFGFSYSMGELMILLSMTAGIATVGFWGIIIGPSLASLTLAAAKILNGGSNPLHEASGSSASETSGRSTPAV